MCFYHVTYKAKKQSFLVGFRHSTLQVEVTLGSLWALWGHFRATLGSLWGHLGVENRRKSKKIDENRPKNHQLADVVRLLGALVRPRAAEGSFNRVFSLKKKERPATRIHQGSTRDPPGTTLSGSMAPGMFIIKIKLKEQERPMGQGI